MATLLYDQFINGIADGSIPISVEEQYELDKAYETLKNVYNWTESVSFIKLSSQKCSDMIIVAGIAFLAKSKQQSILKYGQKIMTLCQTLLLTCDLKRNIWTQLKKEFDFTFQNGVNRTLRDSSMLTPL